MTTVKILENKITSVEKYLDIIKEFKQYSRHDVEHSLIARGVVERYLYLLTQSAIDLAETVIAYKKFRKPTSYSEAFDILQEKKIISLNIADNLGKMTGFRNVLSHGYDKIDYDIVYNVLQSGYKDIEKFVIQIKKMNLKSII